MQKTLLTIALGGAIAAAAVLLLLARPSVDAAGPQAVPSAEQRYAAAAQDTLRGRLRGDGIAFDQVAVYRFGPADERAVCGVVRAPGLAETGFVIRVLLPRDQALSGMAPHYQTVMEQGPGLPHADAQATGRYCRDAGMTAAPPLAAAAMPDVMPAAAGPVLPAAAETAVIRSPARLRSAPGGEVLRIAAQGEALAIFGRAPGGWLQVGTDGPQGWVHASLTSQGH